jgi:methionine-rich copper-binding protein CopC
MRGILTARRAGARRKTGSIAAMPTHMIKRTLLTAAVGLILTLGLVQPGHGHAHLVQAEPAEGAVIAAVPETLRLVFSEPVEIGFSRFALVTFATDAPPDEAERRRLTEGLRDGTLPDAATALEPADAGAGAEVALTPANELAPGMQVVVWRVLSVDGHHTQGSFAFTFAPSGE